MKLNKLHNIKSSGFKTPNHYFESFDEKVINQLQFFSETQTSKNSGFKIPNGYFNTVETSILNKVKSEKKPIAINSKTSKTLYYISGIAASILLCAAIFWNWPSDDSITTEMVEFYFENSELDSYDLAQLLSDENFLEEDFIIAETNYTEDDLETYLLENSNVEAILE